MYAEPQLDPLGALLTEIRDDEDVDDLVDGRVRGYQPAAGDAQPVGKFKAFVVIVTLDAPPEPRVPITKATYAIRCYGVTPQGAWALWGAVVKAIHGAGPRLKASGLGIYLSQVISGGTQDEDPDTRQPLVEGVVRLIATTQAVA